MDGERKRLGWERWVRDLIGQLQQLSLTHPDRPDQFEGEPGKDAMRWVPGDPRL